MYDKVHTQQMTIIKLKKRENIIVAYQRSQRTKKNETRKKGNQNRCKLTWTKPNILNIVQVNTGNNSMYVHTFEFKILLCWMHLSFVYISCVRWTVFKWKKRANLAVKQTHARCTYVCLWMYVWACAHTVMTQRLRLFTDETQIAQKLYGKMICNVAS